MNKLTFGMVLGVLTAQGLWAGDEAITNHLTVITNRLDAIRFIDKLGGRRDSFAIGTNTPAFERYAFDLMVSQCNVTREKWKLDMPHPLSENNVRYCAWPHVFGVTGSVSTKGFGWSFGRNLILQFEDYNYSDRSFNTSVEKIERLAKIKSKITAPEAESIARDAFAALGLTVQQFGLVEPPKVEQEGTENPDGTKIFFPLFKVQWFENQKARDENFAGVTFTISGITKTVVYYFNPCVDAPDLNPPRPALPPDYYDWFGVLPPMNEDQRMGYKPLTRKP